MPLFHPNRPMPCPYPLPPSDTDSDEDDPNIYGPVVQDYPYRPRRLDELPRNAVRVDLGYSTWVRAARSPSGDIIFFALRALCPRFTHHLQCVLGDLTREQMLRGDFHIEVVNCQIQITYYPHNGSSSSFWTFPYVSTRYF